MKARMSLRGSVAAALASGMLLVATGAPALAAPEKVVTGITGDVTAVNPTTIDRSRTVDLTIIRDAVVDEKGNEQSNSGITFSLKLLDGFAVNTKEGLEKAINTSVEDAKKIDGKTFTTVTDSSGRAQLDSLPVGVYLVTEKTPANAGPFYREAEPFVLLLPVYSQKEEAWSYSVGIRPKTAPLPGDKPRPPEPQPNNPSGSSVLIPFLPILLVPPPSVNVPPPAPAPEPPTTPMVPEPEQPPAPTKGIPKIPMPLPNTGADVLWYGLGGALAVVAGLLLVYRKKSSGHAM